MIIVNAKIITWGRPNRILEGYAIRINGQKIDKIDLQNKLVAEYPDEEKLDARGQYLMPGLICSHTHFYGAFSRGMAIPGAAPADFPEILEKLWWPLDQALTIDDVKYSTLVCLLDSIKHGNTTVFDHHASPNAIEGSLDAIAAAIMQSGMRGVLCYEVTDRGGEERTKKGIHENVRMIKRAASEDFEGRIAANFGIHASLTVSENTLNECRNAVDKNVGFHIHVAEHQVDEYDSMQKYGMRVIDRLKKHDMLGINTIIGHGVHMDMKEIELLAESKTWLSHQPRSNMNNAVGMADIDSIVRMGVKVCLGNDGFSNAMWDEWRTCYLVHKVWNRDPRRMNGSTVIDMGVYNNADLASRYFSTAGKVGVIEEGAQADLILVDYRPFTELTEGNLPWQILFGFRDSMVTTTMVAGKLLMKDNVFMTLDQEEIYSNALKRSKEVWKRYESQF